MFLLKKNIYIIKNNVFKAFFFNTLKPFLLLYNYYLLSIYIFNTFLFASGHKQAALNK